MNTATSTLITKEALPIMLPRALPWLQKTLEEYTWTTWTLEDLVHGLHTGRFQLWSVGGQHKYLFVVTEVVQEVIGTSVHIVMGGGQLHEHAVGHISLIEKWAKQIGATSVVVIGRLGWRKQLAKNGYEFEAASYRKVLKDKMQ